MIKEKHCQTIFQGTDALHHLSRQCTWIIIIIMYKKRTCWIVDFAVPADHRMKLKESKKKDKYLGPC